jgi:hypothetical protein
MCKYPCAKIRSEPYLWIRFDIDHPLNEAIPGEFLLLLTDRIQGLSLGNWTRIKHVLDSTLKLTKLQVPGQTQHKRDSELFNKFQCPQRFWSFEGGS